MKIGLYGQNKQVQAMIPPHQQANALREYDEWLDRERHVIERFINMLDHIDTSFFGSTSWINRFSAFFILPAY